MNPRDLSRPLPLVRTRRVRYPDDVERRFVAHLALDRALLDGRSRPQLSPAAAVLVDLMLVENVHRVLLPRVLTVLRVTRHVSRCWRDTPDGEPDYVHELQCVKSVRYCDVVRLAQSVERLTVDDLSLIPREAVLQCLGSHPVQPKKRKKKTLADLHHEIARESAA